MAHTLRVLLVDRDPRESEQISSRLSRACHCVIAASGLEEASEFLEVQRFDAVLLASSAAMDGKESDGALGEFTARVRALDACQRSAERTPVLSLVSPESADSVHTDGYLPPSFDPATLVDAVAGLAQALSTTPQRSAAGDEFPVFDCEKLNAQAGNDPELVSEIVGLFLSDQEKQFSQMRQSLAAGDYSQLAYVAHTIKGSFGTLGAMACWSRAQQLEHAAKQSDEGSCHELLQSLESALRGLLPQLQALSPGASRN